MSDESPSSQTSAPEAEHWSARHGKSIIFVILTLVAAGAYLAVTIPIAVFPSTDFPRIIVGVDNGVMPIDQMLVTITRPVEDALNTVQGLERVTSITSRGSAEIDLYFSWKVEMFQTLDLVNAALARVESTHATHRESHFESADIRRIPDHGLQPDVGQRTADATLGDRKL